MMAEIWRRRKIPCTCTW